MNQVKSILLTSISILSFCISCTNTISFKDDFVLNLNYTSKDLHKLYYGNDYYGINGIKYKDKTNDVILKKPNSILLLEIKNDFINNYKNIALLEEPLKLYLHDLNEINPISININFNDYLRNKFYITPIFSVENLELLKNRSSKIYNLKDEKKLIPYYIDELNYEERDILLKDIMIYEESIKNIKNLEKIGLYPIFFESLKLIHNPLSGIYSIYPDLRYFSKKKNNLFKKIQHNLNVFQNSNKVMNENVIISRDTILNKNLILNNVNLKISQGVNIKLLNNASIFINNSVINFDGQKNQKIKITGHGNNSIILNKCDKININFVDFNGLSNLYNDSLKLTGGITIYNSDIKISNSTFSENIRGDDFINFYNSTFEVSSSLFENIFADAIDSDFSKGTINKTNFQNIGNDALDFSGTESKINEVRFQKVQDKALSAGENSIISIINSYFYDSELGIVVKDGSKLFSNENIFENNQIDYCAFIKKNFYENPSLNISDYKNETYLFQNGVNIISNNNKLFDKVNDVESLLYGNVYGKSSK